MKTKYDIKPNETAKQFMTLTGVPAGLLAGISFDLGKILNTFEAGVKEKKVITVKQQLGYWEQLQTRYSPCVAVINSKTEYQLARQLATVLFWLHLSHHLNNNTTALPFWYNPSADFKNELIEQYKQGEHTAPRLLVLDNVYQDMPAIKLDKVIDILNIMNNRPRLIVLRSDDPYTYCNEVLGIKPNCILQIGSVGNVKRTKI